MHLVEISVVDQRYQAVMAVFQDGWKVSEVAEHFGVARQTIHRWIARYNAGGVLTLADGSHRPHGCSHQIPPELEALICEVRRLHPGWGPRRILHELGRRGVDPLPGRSSIYRCLKRHNLIELRRRKKRRDEFRRWERERPMQLWQMDVMGGVLLDDGTGSARGYTCALWNLRVTITVLYCEMMPFSRYAAVAVLVILVAACERQADAVKVTGVTTFDARVVGLSWSPAEQCDGRKRACTRAKIVVTNVGADEGDSMCSVRMLDAQGQKVTVVGLLIASNLAPGESKSWVVDFPGGAKSGRSRCSAYDPGALRNVG